MTRVIMYRFTNLLVYHSERTFLQYQTGTLTNYHIFTFKSLVNCYIHPIIKLSYYYIYIIFKLLHSSHYYIVTFISLLNCYIVTLNCYIATLIPTLRINSPVDIDNFPCDVRRFS